MIDFAHPYIPNSDTTIQKKILQEIGARDIEALFAEIPEAIRFRGTMDLPEPLLSECSLNNKLMQIINKNKTTSDHLSFLGGGCYNHYVPAVCDEINSRSEFLTGYAGEPFEDHGRFQALFEYASLLGELLDMDMVSIPTYDGSQAAASSLRMAARITHRKKILVPDILSWDKKAIIENYTTGILDLEYVKNDPATGKIDMDDLASNLSKEVAAVYMEMPSFAGIIDEGAKDIGQLAHDHGALFVVGVDPSSLGIISPPIHYGADIVCGDLQPLGLHLACGGNLAGFIASSDDEKFVSEYPTRLFGIESTTEPGEYGFGDVTFDRTSFGARENGKEFIGTAAALNGITAGVYLSLMGPQGMKDLGTTIFNNTDYLKHRLSKINGIKILFKASASFKEVCVQFNTISVDKINKKLLAQGIFGSVDISGKFMKIQNAAMFCTTEIHTKKDIDRLCQALESIID
ncbi:MAG: aminomethyl-transferring glycine dehydrogenase subunit GcvPA [Proteobacteria bacterium]|nr:aminomethyl-transferring glycine dehydrogenase subunit GcvPA [Pseudomonadota bacterium]MBU1585055.1 aminomethyl-transferring glycine dehydrogenase subunit GcvPA [Pseudomonadota bacterium]MBU2456013.1 aminomethyl-transferring glycine dehydrogenase subunit GcvPA [Pseudomonadota bacterium]MBU2627357.1 aminomethyl-transferring glycine dehydrogenase subunit GcvPA [Pseudomonadota bacterium]